MQDTIDSLSSYHDEAEELLLGASSTNKSKTHALCMLCLCIYLFVILSPLDNEKTLPASSLTTDHDSPAESDCELTAEIMTAPILQLHENCNITYVLRSRITSQKR